MRHTTLIIITFALVLCFVTAGPAGALAFTNEELAAGNGLLIPMPQDLNRQYQADHAAAQQHQRQQDIDAASARAHQFRPEEYRGMAPQFLFTPRSGDNQVCRHGYNNSISCQ